MASRLALANVASEMLFLIFWREFFTHPNQHLTRQSKGISTCCYLIRGHTTYLHDPDISDFFREFVYNYQVAPLHCFQSWPPGRITCIATLPWIALLALSVRLSWYPHQPESHQLSLHKVCDGHPDPKIRPQVYLGPIKKSKKIQHIMTPKS